MPPARALVVLALLLASTALVARADDDEPRATDLVERAEARLAQVQITASGPPDVLSSLTPDDVKLKVGFTRIREFLLKRQRTDGSWVNSIGPGEAFSTAMACLILEIPYDFLPIFHR